MAKEELRAFVNRDVLLAFCVLGIVVGVVTTVLRLYVRLTRQKQLHSDDYAHLVSFVVFMALCILYVINIPALYHYFDYVTGKIQYDQELAENYHTMASIIAATTALFWATLWSVKLNLLLFFRRVLRNTKWMKAWWVVLVFTGVCFIGCIISEITSCKDPRSWTVLGKCVTPDEQRRQIISLYFSFGADVVTEVAIMALPLRVLLDLKVSRRDKITLGCLFCVGGVALIVSFIRVFLIWAKTGSTTPSIAWLALWAVVECTVAIIFGSIPAISQAFRQSLNRDREEHRGYAMEQRPPVRANRALRETSSQSWCSRDESQTFEQMMNEGGRIPNAASIHQKRETTVSRSQTDVTAEAGAAPKREAWEE